MASGRSGNGRHDGEGMVELVLILGGVEARISVEGEIPTVWYDGGSIVVIPFITIRTRRGRQHAGF